MAKERTESSGVKSKETNQSQGKSGKKTIRARISAGGPGFVQLEDGALILSNMEGVLYFLHLTLTLVTLKPSCIFSFCGIV